MKPLIQSIRDIDTEQESLRSRPYGMIEVAHGQLVRVQLKPWPKIGSLLEASWISHWKNTRRAQDCCRIFYNQPIQHRNYLALTYIESTWNTTLITVFAALHILDRIAFIKRSDAILIEVTNQRISDRILERLGWQRHLEHKKQRHWIKRFYGEYSNRAKGIGALSNASADFASGR